MSEVSMPSRAYASLLPTKPLFICQIKWLCQCPLGLMPHCYENSIYSLIAVAREGCQCPLGLMPHCYRLLIREYYQKGRKGVKCPLGLMPHCYSTPSKPRFYVVSRACFCRYLSEYSDNNSFSCMLTIWTYLMRQIILLTLI